MVVCDLFHRADDVGELAHTGGLNDDPIGIVLCDHLGQGLTKVAHQAAADTAGVHFGNVDTGILQKAAVDADLAEFVFDEHQLLALIGFGNQLLNEGGLTGTQEAAVNIDLCHEIHLLFSL